MMQYHLLIYSLFMIRNNITFSFFILFLIFL
nr:MAG TPA: hypothetical protein [Caudoviricetes sp.]